MRRLTVATAALVLLAVAGLAGWSALASPTSASVYRSQGATAYADLVGAVDECVQVRGLAWASEWTNHEPPAKAVSTSLLTVEIDVYDVCTYTPLGLYNGWNYSADVDISWEAASADGRVTVCTGEETPTCFDVDVSLDWQATGAAGVINWRGHDSTCNSHSHQGRRPAVLSGTLTLVESGLTLTPDPAIIASMDFWQGGQVCQAPSISTVG